MHIDMQNLHQVFLSVAITHLLSKNLGLEKRIAGKYDLQTSTGYTRERVAVNFNPKPKVLNRRKFPDVIRTDRKLTTIILSLEEIPEDNGS